MFQGYASPAILAATAVLDLQPPVLPVTVPKSFKGQSAKLAATQASIKTPIRSAMSVPPLAQPAQPQLPNAIAASQASS